MLTNKTHLAPPPPAPQKSADAASITLSLPVMSAGKQVVICLTGEKKVRATERLMGPLPTCTGSVGLCPFPTLPS
jgi:hypothetical protein